MPHINQTQVILTLGYSHDNAPPHVTYFTNNGSPAYWISFSLDDERLNEIITPLTLDAFLSLDAAHKSLLDQYVDSVIRNFEDKKALRLQNPPDPDSAPTEFGFHTQEDGFVSEDFAEFTDDGYRVNLLLSTEELLDIYARSAIPRVIPIKFEGPPDDYEAYINSPEYISFINQEVARYSDDQGLSLSPEESASDEAVSAFVREAYKDRIRTAIGRLLGKTAYRTRQKSGATVPMPPVMPIISTQKYQYSITLNELGKAYLTNKNILPDVSFEQRQITCPGTKAQIARFGSLFPEGMPRRYEDEDRFVFQAVFAFLYERYKINPDLRNADARPFTIYLPDLAYFMGYERNMGKNVILGLLRSFERLQYSYGVIKVKNTQGQDMEQRLGLLSVLEADTVRTSNTIRLISPFCHHLIQELYETSIIRDKNGQPKRNELDEVKTRAVVSYLVHSDILKERNHRAVDIVNIVVSLIEQTGTREKNVPNIGAMKLVSRVPELDQIVKNPEISKSDKNKYLKRTFVKAWDLLHTRTDLEKAYIDIQLPNPKDPAMIPTMDMLVPGGKKIKPLIYRFPHKGRRKESG